MPRRNYKRCRDPEAWEQFTVAKKQSLRSFLNEIDEHLKYCLTGADQERDRMMFRLYLRQGMSTIQIVSVPTIGLSAKGVGSVIERLNHGIQEQILGFRSDSGDGEGLESKANSLAKSY